MPQTPNRRDILKSLAAMTAAVIAAPALRAQSTPASPDSPATRDKWGDLLPLRRLGKSGPSVTMLGVGGHHITMFMDEPAAQKTIETAIAGGIRFFEMGLAYGDGAGEERYGKLLVPKYRDNIFLMSKATASTAEAARTQLDDSLRRLKTDYLDLWQMHNISTLADAERRTAALTGALDVLVEAREKGRVKNIGFTGHLNPAVHARVLDRLKERNIQLNTIQMPINVTDPSYTRSFVLQILPRALDAGMGVIAMKTFANGGFYGGAEGLPGNNPKIIPDRMTAADALHFVWSLPVCTAICGVHSPAMLQEKIDAARSFSPLSETQRAALIAKVADLAGIVVEVYKSDTRRSPESLARDAARAATRAATQPATAPAKSPAN